MTLVKAICLGRAQCRPSTERLAGGNKVKRLTIGTRVIAISALLMLLLTLIGGAGLLGMSKMNTTLSTLNDNYVAGVDQLGEARSQVFQARGVTFMAALPGISPEFRKKRLAEAEGMEAKALKTLKDYDTPGSIYADERPLYDAVKSQTISYLGTLKHFRLLVAEGKLEEAARFWEREGAAQFPTLQTAYAAEVKFNSDGVVTSVNASTSAARLYSKLTWIMFAIAIGSGVILAIVVVSSINSSLRKSVAEIRVSAQQVSSASAQVASAGGQLARTSSQQAATLEETSASGQEVSAMTQRNAESARTAAELMTEVDGKVSLANKKVEQMVTSMNAITTSSERISKIIKVIDDIAFQTNILALNAAVEAARAGESGLGFAVVADEVRSLAQRCAQAAKDTTNLIDESVENARTGSTRLDEVAEVISSVTKSAVKVKTLAEEVSLGSVEQARGTDQISRALVQLEQSTQQAAASAEESASASQELLVQASSMQKIVISLEALFSRQSVRTTGQEPLRVPEYVAENTHYNETL